MNLLKPSFSQVKSCTLEETHKIGIANKLETNDINFVSVEDKTLIMYNIKITIGFVCNYLLASCNCHNPKSVAYQSKVSVLRSPA